MQSGKIVSEKLLDDILVKRVKKAGGRALKRECPSFTGMPDRDIFLPDAVFCMVEIKTTGKKLSPRQEVVIPWLRSLGFIVFVVDTREGLDEVFKYLKI